MGRSAVMKNKIKEMAYISLGAVIMSVCSFIALPFPIPFTFQTFGFFSVLLLLGGKKGSLSVILYILLGTFGIPVFAGFGAGFGYLLGPTGGFVIGFSCGAFVYWGITSVRRDWRIAGLVASLGVCYVCGTLWYMLYCSVNSHRAELISALLICVVPYLIPDLLKLILACVICKRLKPYIKSEC